MRWLQIRISTSSYHPEVISEALTKIGALAVTFQGAKDELILEPLPGETPLWSDTEIVGLFSQNHSKKAIQQQLLSQFTDMTITFEYLPDQPWARAWCLHFKPMRFGEHLWVCPSGHAIDDEAAVKVLLDPGLAFGTGTHPTTAMCLTWLSSQNLRDKTVIDYGCGSGILGIAAIKLGAGHVTAIDIDQQALTATEENARRNIIDESQLQTCLPHIKFECCVDLLMANILANPLIALAPTFRSLLKPGGQLLLSGILESQIGLIEHAYHPTVLNTLDHQDGWVLLAGTV